MTDHGMLFSGLMVSAQRKGLKTQTRRILTPKHIKLWSETARRFIRPTDELLDAAMTEVMDFKRIGNIWTWSAAPMPHQQSAVKTVWMGETPIQPGDRLWVKENWRAHEWLKDCVAIAYAAEKSSVGWTEQHELIPYPDGDRNAFKYYAPKGPDKWRPSIHMPRWASRITLCVTDVRIERLQDITEADAVAEGCFKGKASGRVFQSAASMHLGGDEWRNGRDWYADLWDTINGPDAWEKNPWVIAYTFNVHLQNIDRMTPAIEGAAA